MLYYLQVYYLKFALEMALGSKMRVVLRYSSYCYFLPYKLKVSFLGLLPIQRILAGGLYFIFKVNIDRMV